MDGAIVTPAALHEQRKAAVLDSPRDSCGDRNHDGIGILCGDGIRDENGSLRGWDPAKDGTEGMGEEVAYIAGKLQRCARQHHDEATEALVVEALSTALAALTDSLCGKHRCYKCEAKAKVEAALKALGK